MRDGMSTIVRQWLRRFAVWFLLPVCMLVVAGGGYIVVMDRFEPVPSLEGLKYTDASIDTDTRVADLLSRMTLREKIGQMALVEKNSFR